jgi:glycosyltransferase 2 family protein
MDTKTLRSRLILTCKLGLGIGLLGWLLLSDDNWRKLVVLVADIQPLYLLHLVAVSVLLFGISCLKWNLFLRERGVVVAFHRLFALYVIGIFFNNFLPTNFGGDVVRAYYLGRQIASQAQSLASVVLERLTGLVALATLALVAYALTPALRHEPLVTASLATLAAGCAAVLVALWHPSLVKAVLGPLERSGPLRRLVAKLHHLHGHVAYFRDKRALVAKAMAYSFLFHIGTALNVYVAALVLGVELSFLRLLVVTPIILVIASVPLTPNSLGVWEWAFSVYLIPAGAALEQGLEVALLLRATMLVTSIFGGVLFLAEGRTARVAGAAREQQEQVSPPGLG